MNEYSALFLMLIQHRLSSDFVSFNFRFGVETERILDNSIPDIK